MNAGVFDDDLEPHLRFSLQQQKEWKPLDTQAGSGQWTVVHDTWEKGDVDAKKELVGLWTSVLGWDQVSPQAAPPPTPPVTPGTAPASSTTPAQPAPAAPASMLSPALPTTLLAGFGTYFMAVPSVAALGDLSMPTVVT